jgi:DNA polymerase I-like protein with 3'-5' exonuclease and polymerase domains
MNIPRKSVIKNLFISRFEGGYFGQLDYSQIELRIAATLSKDPFLIDAYMSGVDIHKYTAALMYGIPIESVTKEQRQAAKTINFGNIYGMGPEALAAQLKISVDGAKEFLNKYFAVFEILKQWINLQRKEIVKCGYAKSILGRVRDFSEILKWVKPGTTKVQEHLPKYIRRKFYDCLREGVNHKIQSPAADLTHFSVRYLQGYLTDNNCKSCILGTVYDSIMLDLHPDEVGEILTTAKMIMEGIPELERLDWITIPILAEVEIGRNWGNLHKVIFEGENKSVCGDNGLQVPYFDIEV